MATTPTKKRTKIPNEADVDRELVKRNGLYQFMELAWPILEPSKPLIPNWHISAICDHTQALYHGDIQRLLINIPPRMNKSMICAVFAPAWAWTDDPTLRMMFVSYSKSLSNRDSVKTRRIIESPWYQERWGKKFKLSDDSNTKELFENDKSGSRMAGSVSGTITGTGADIATADDLLSRLQAESAAFREGASECFWETMPSRFNDRETGRLLVIQQRLHSRDTTGEIVEREKLKQCGKWEKLILPMEYEKKTFVEVTSLGFKDPRKIDGEVLHPERFKPKTLLELKQDLGSYAYAGQYQQRPVPREGGLIKESWLSNRFNCDMRLETLMERKPVKILQSSDCASKAGEKNDPTVIITAAVFKDKHVEVWHVWRKRVEFPEGKRAFKDSANHWKPNVILIEDKDAGQQYIQQLRSEKDYKVPIIKCDPEGLDKYTRMDAESPFIEAGNLWLPEHASWIAEFVTELTLYPSTDHDDQVDALSQLLKYLRRQNLARQMVAPASEEGESSNNIY